MSTHSRRNAAPVHQHGPYGMIPIPRPNVLRLAARIIERVRGELWKYENPLFVTVKPWRESVQVRRGVGGPIVKIPVEVTSSVTQVDLHYDPATQTIHIAYPFSEMRSWFRQRKRGVASARVPEAVLAEQEEFAGALLHETTHAADITISGERAAARRVDEYTQALAEAGLDALSTVFDVKERAHAEYLDYGRPAEIAAFTRDLAEQVAWGAKRGLTFAEAIARSRTWQVLERRRAEDAIYPTAAQLRQLKKTAERVYNDAVAGKVRLNARRRRA